MKILYINACLECVYLQQPGEGEAFCGCLYEQRELKEIDDIPEWCPLDEYVPNQTDRSGD